MAKKEGLDLKPDAVLLYFGHNDFSPVSYLLTRVDGSDMPHATPNDWELYRARMRPEARASHWLFIRSNLYRGLVHMLRPKSAEARPRNRLREVAGADRAA